MQAFIMHVGHPGNIDIKYTVTRRRRMDEIFSALSKDAPEKDFFSATGQLSQLFPSGDFHCWGVPSRAEPAFEKTEIGDLILMIPSIGIHQDAGVKQIGIVKAKCPFRCNEASHILWPDTPDDRLFPWIFFFDTEIGDRPWFEFLNDVDIKENWDPRGWYKRLNSKRFLKWGGVSGYVDFLRSKCGFRKLQ